MTIISLGFSKKGFARAQVNTECALNETSGELVGLRSNVSYTLASVSKVFTTFWAVNALGPDYRFPHLIFISPTGARNFDVHISGSQFPYFDRSMLHHLASQLKLKDITSVNRLTFDENFEYSSIVRTNPKLAHQNKDQDTAEIRNELRRDLNRLLPVKSIELVSTTVFQPSGNTSKFLYQSVPLHRILKEMNRNSHNFAADKIFEKLQRKESFESFMKTKPSIPTGQYAVYNGSGYPTGFNGKKVYNTATCTAVVTMMSELQKSLSEHNYNFTDIMAVSGKDAAADGESTVSQIYGDKATEGVLIAKTGTVADTVALAGLVSSEKGPVYFHTSYVYDSSAEERRQAYDSIRDRLHAELIRNGGKRPFGNYQPVAFLPYDKMSLLVLAD